MNHLKSKNVYKAVKTPRPDVKLVKGDANNAIEYRRSCEILDKWDSMDEAAQGKISERVHTRYKLKIKDCQTAKEMIEKVKTIYAGNITSAMINARDEFNDLTCSSTEGVENFLSKIDQCRERLKETDSKISDIEAALKTSK